MFTTKVIRYLKNVYLVYKIKLKKKKKSEIYDFFCQKSTIVVRGFFCFFFFFCQKSVVSFYKKKKKFHPNWSPFNFKTIAKKSILNVYIINV